MRRVAMVMAMLAAMTALTGCLPVAPEGQPILSPYERSCDSYLATGRALEAARAKVVKWKEAELLSVEEVEVYERVWAEAQAAMEAWQRLLARAEANGGSLPPDHPALLAEILPIIWRFEAWVLKTDPRFRSPLAPLPTTS